MADSQNLLLRESHFAFGENWARYATSVGHAQIQEAVVALRRLVGDSLIGKTFLDIGCGSGIHALAAVRWHDRRSRIRHPEGAGPTSDPQELLGDFWPGEENIDDFLAALREWRRTGWVE